MRPAWAAGLALLVALATWRVWALRGGTNRTIDAPRQGDAHTPVRSMEAASIVADTPVADASRQRRRAWLSQELALEQLRYGAGYWEAELSSADCVALDEARRALPAATTGAGGDAFEPFFGSEQAGPCVRFLAPDVRERLLDVLAGMAEHAPLTGAAMMIGARAALSDADFEQYRRWNAPEAVALRERLAGFGPSQREFDAIRTHADAAPETQEVLRAELGEDRYAEWRRQESAEMQTALREVRRAGGEAADAVWLCAQRSRFVEDLSRVWSDATLTPAEKEQRCAALKQAGRAALAARWPNRTGELPEIDLLP